MSNLGGGPVQGETESFRDALRAKLIDQGVQQQRRRKHRRTVGFASLWVVVVALGASLAVVGGRPEPAGADVVSVRAEGDYRVVRLTTFDASPDQIRTDLGNAGIRVTVDTVPVPPSAVGRFVTAQATATTTDVAFQPLEERDGVALGFRLKADTRSTIELQLGRPATGDERYVAAIDAYLPGNALHCSMLWGTPATTAQAWAKERGISIRYVSPTDQSLAAASPPRGLVTDAQQTAPSEVLVFLNTAPTSPFARSQTTGASDCR